MFLARPNSAATDEESFYFLEISLYSVLHSEISILSRYGSRGIFKILRRWFALPRDRLCCISGTLSSPAFSLLCSEVPVTRSQLLTLSTSSRNLVVSARLIGSFPQMLFVAGMVCSNEVFRVGEGGYILIDGTGKGLDILWLSMVESI